MKPPLTHTQDEEGNIIADEDIKEEDLDYLEFIKSIRQL